MVITYYLLRMDFRFPLPCADCWLLLRAQASIRGQVREVKSGERVESVKLPGLQPFGWTDPTGVDARQGWGGGRRDIVHHHTPDGAIDEPNPRGA